MLLFCVIALMFKRSQGRYEGQGTLSSSTQDKDQKWMLKPSGERLMGNRICIQGAKTCQPQAGKVP